jgi:small neutral amino acid transporter SnatA (MarC family)
MFYSIFLCFIAIALIVTAQSPTGQPSTQPSSKPSMQPKSMPPTMNPTKTVYTVITVTQVRNSFNAILILTIIMCILFYGYSSHNIHYSLRRSFADWKPLFLS